MPYRDILLAVLVQLLWAVGFAMAKPAVAAPIPGVVDDDPEDLASRLIFRAHPDMVRAAWVRGRRLEGPGGR